ALDEYFPAAVSRHRADDAVLLHHLDHAGRAGISDAEPSLQERGRGLPGADHDLLGLLVHLVTPTLVHGRLLLHRHGLLGEGRTALGLGEFHDPSQISLRHVGAVPADQFAAAGGEVENVAAAHPQISAGLYDTSAVG